MLLRHQRDTKGHASPAPIDLDLPSPPSNEAHPDTECPSALQTEDSQDADTTISNVDPERFAQFEDFSLSDGLGLDDIYLELGQNYSSWLDFDLTASNHLSEITPISEQDPQFPSSLPADLPGSKFTELRFLWFTRLADFRDGGCRSRSVTPSETQTQFDETYRQSLRMSLDIHQPEPQLPPAPLMNLCISLFYSHCQPILPLIHTPTLNPSRTNSNVLLAMCAMGSLCSGSDYLVQQGLKMFVQLQKSTLNKWEKIIALSFDAVISVLQCIIICQTYGLLSGQENILQAVDSFHGPPVAWAWQFGIFDAKPLSDLDLSAQGAELDALWQRWVRSEEVIRISLSLHLIDAEIAKIFHHDPILRFAPRRLQRASSAKTFMAPNAKEWRDLYLAELQHQNPDTTAWLLPSVNVSLVPWRGVFTAITLLQGIIIRILEMKTEGSSGITMQYQEDQLMALHAQFRLSDHQQQEAVQFRILWHVAFIYVSADVGLLEKAAGREGRLLSVSEEAQISQWVTSEQAHRSCLHALLIQKQVEEVSRNEELAVHVPLAMFVSGLVWYCYLRHGNKTGVDFRTLAGHCRFRELNAIEVKLPNHLSQTRGFGNERFLAWGPLISLTDLLRRTGHWGISRKFAKILSALVELEFDKK